MDDINFKFNSGKILGLMYEKLWHVMFGEPDLLPMRGENANLPLFLRARDVDNESYLPSGSQYMSTAMTIGDDLVPQDEVSQQRAEL